MTDVKIVKQYYALTILFLISIVPFIIGYKDPVLYSRATYVVNIFGLMLISPYLTKKTLPTLYTIVLVTMALHIYIVGVKDNGIQYHAISDISKAFIILIAIEFFKYKYEELNKGIRLNIILFSAACIFIALYNPEIAVRAHELMIFSIVLYAVGFKLEKKEVFIIISTVLFLTIYSYESRILVGISILLLYSYFIYGSVKKRFLYAITIAVIVTVGYENQFIDEKLFLRIQELGLDSWGRQYIYYCIYNNLDKVSLIGSSYNDVKECSPWGNLHSSYLEFLIRYGIMPFVVVIIIYIKDFKKRIKNNEHHNLAWGVTTLMLAAVEPGLEWIGLLVLIKYLVGLSTSTQAYCCQARKTLKNSRI